MEDARLPSVRAADADRERVLEVVRQAHAEGRLTTTEFYDRLEGVYQAKTFGELDELVVDLPAGTAVAPLAVPSPQRAAVARPDPAGLLAQMPTQLRAVWITWATVVSINVLIWLIVSVTAFADNDQMAYFWPIWVAGPWGVVNAGITLSWRLNRKDGREPPALPPASG